MPKQYNIKWRIEDERKLSKVARDFNNKLNRLIDKNPNNKNILPQFYNPATQQLESEINVATLKSLIKTRVDYNRYVGMLERFLKEGAEEIVDAPGNQYGSKTTRWHIQEMGRLKGIVNRRKQERLDMFKDIEMASSKGELGYSLGERFGMGLASRNQLSPTNAFTPSQTQIDINFKLSSLMKQSKSAYYNEKDMVLKNNYIRELERNFNRSDVADVIKAINNMDNDLFVLKFEAHGDRMEMVYPPERGTPEYEANVEELRNYWLNTNALQLTPAILATLLNT